MAPTLRKRGSKASQNKRKPQEYVSSEQLAQEAYDRDYPPLYKYISLKHILLLISIAAVGSYFYVSYMLFEWPPLSPYDHSNHDYPFKVVDMPGKGKGVVATRDISQGELILREEPLLRVPTSISRDPGEFISSIVARLPPPQRMAFYNLSYVNLPSLRKGTKEFNDAVALAIFQTNAVAAGDHSGLFPRMSRLNHGCVFGWNSAYSWRDDEGVIMVHALKPVKMGEELLTTYFDTKRPRADRHQFLRQRYGFTCTCAACSLPDAESDALDARLTRMQTLYARFTTWQHQTISGKEAIETAKEIWKIGDEIGYWSERGQLAADAALVSAAHGDGDATRAWAQVAKKWYTYELGSSSQQVQWIRRILENPRSHPVWRTRNWEEVGLPGPAIPL